MRLVRPLLIATLLVGCQPSSVPVPREIVDLSPMITPDLNIQRLGTRTLSFLDSSDGLFLPAVGTDDAAFLEQRYPGVTFRRANGLALPFEPADFDVVHSSAVLEHVGGAREQQRFLGELARVARRAVFVTTPNRWFPIEVHTQIPLLHWLPKPLFRKLLGATRHGFFAREENLNLLGRGELARLAGALPGWTVAIEPLRLFGWPSNLLLTLRRDGA